MAQFFLEDSRQRDGDLVALRTESIEPSTGKGTPGPDRIRGTDGDDTIDGLGGDDVLAGRYGYDHLIGGAGDDVLRGGSERQEQGGAGRDLLDGGKGDDRLFGGFESDGLTGGAGKDRFVYTALTDTTLEHPDTITDFTQRQDKLVFRDQFRAGAGLHFIGDADFSHTPGEVRFAVGNGESVVSIDMDGDGSTDLWILFPAEITFQASDFVF